MKKVFILAFLFIITQITCTKKTVNFIPYSNPEIEYWGRIDSTSEKAAALYWSGTSIKINFEGESIQALMQDETGDNYYNVIIDNDSLFILRPDTNKTYYQLASNLPRGKHHVEIFKRTEYNRGKTLFFGFELGNDAKLLAKSPVKKKKIEFYGNSITAGYAVEDTTGNDSPDSTYTNNYLSFAAITARHFDAKFQCICRSGIGVTISWFPTTMPELYNRLIPNDTTSTWDFSLFTPDVVVINLLQNDSWLITQTYREDFKKRFGTTIPDDAYMINAYQEFVSKIRDHYPKASIICALGNMSTTQKGSKWMGIVEKAVTNLNDENIYTHFFPYKETAKHPSKEEQEAMAKSLIQFIDEHIDW